MPEYALFKDGVQVSKAHSTVAAVRVEAYETDAFTWWTNDFNEGDGSGGKALSEGCEIRKVEDAE